MKTLFIIVSMIAFSYLVLQTSLVKNFIVDVTQAIDFNIPSNQDENNTDEAFINKINALEMQSARERDIYTKRISDLEKNVSLLTQKVSDIKQQKRDKPSSLAFSDINENDKRNNAELTNNKENDEDKSNSLLDKNTLLGNPSVKPISTVVAKEQISHQQKRLEQQAVLRSLSQKLELAALNSLTH
jgi:hypothetical protein